MLILTQHIQIIYTDKNPARVKATIRQFHPPIQTHSPQKSINNSMVKYQFMVELEWWWWWCRQAYVYYMYIHFVSYIAQRNNKFIFDGTFGFLIGLHMNNRKKPLHYITTTLIYIERDDDES